MSLNKLPYRGTRDFFPAQMRLRDYIFDKMKIVSERFGFEPYDGPLLEEVELYLAKSGEELINEQIYSFIDRGERKVAIRPEMTPTVARMVAQIHREVPKPVRWYAIPNLMRYEKPQKGRLREFWQYNADIFGAGLYGEVEAIQLAVAIMKEFGATQDQFEILVNDRKIVEAYFNHVLKISPEQSLKLSKVIDKAKKVSAEGLDKMILEVLTDEAQIRSFKSYLELTTFDDLKAFLKKSDLTEVLTHITSFVSKLELCKINQYVKYDPTIVRGLDYYTGIVFEIFDKHPENKRAIAGGGSYANLLQIFNEPALEGVGFGLGEVPLTEFLKSHELLPQMEKAQLDFLISYGLDEAETFAFELSSFLREKKLKVELYPGASKPKKVFGYADKKDIRYFVYLGEDEVSNKKFIVKNLKEKTQMTYDFHDLTKMIEGLKG